MQGRLISHKNRKGPPGAFAAFLQPQRRLHGLGLHFQFRGKPPKPVSAPLPRDAHWPLPPGKASNQGINDGEGQGKKTRPNQGRSAGKYPAAVRAPKALHKKRFTKPFEIAGNTTVPPNSQAKTWALRPFPIERGAVIGYLLEADVLAANHRCREARNAHEASSGFALSCVEVRQKP